MTRGDRRCWRAARTLGDLGALTAQWLEGRLTEHPGYPGGLDPETEPLVPTLAACNRSGLVTISSQPATARERGFDGAWWEQRAFVEGLVADAGVLRRLASLADDAGLLCVAHRYCHGCADCPAGVTVTTRDGEPFTRAGMHIPYDDLRLQFEGCQPAALDAVCSAWQVAVVDPVWGRNAVLWPLLELERSRPVGALP